MKLLNVFAKLTTGSNRVLTMFGGMALAAAACTVAAPAAAAQQFGIGVQLGGPRYVAPAPVYGTYARGYVVPRYGYTPGYWEERRAEEWRAREWHDHAFRDHGYWERRGGFYR